MSKNATAAPAEVVTPEAPAAAAATIAPPVDAAQLKAQAEADARKSVTEQLTRFSNVFGAEGAGYFTEGLSFEDAATKHITKLSADLADARKAAAEAAEKVSQAASQLGEQNAVDTGKPPVAEGKTAPARNMTEARAAAKKS